MINIPADQIELARAAAGTAAVTIASYRALARWQAASSLLAPHELDSHGKKPNTSETGPSKAETDAKPLQRVNQMLLQNALCMGHLMGFEQVREPDLMGVLKANGLYSAISIICRDASRALIPLPRTVSLRKRDINAPMQGRYDLTFGDPPNKPVAALDTDSARSTLGAICSAAIFYDAYTGGTAYVPALTAGLVLMIASHWVIASVRMRWVVLFVLGVAVPLDLLLGFFQGTPIAVAHNQAEAIGIRPWFAILGQLVQAARYAIPGIFMTVQLRYEYAQHHRLILRKAADLGIPHKRVRSTLVPPVRVNFYPIFTLCLLALAAVPVMAEQYAPGSNLRLPLAAVVGRDVVYGGETLLCVLAVLGVAALGAVVKGDLKGWLEYYEVWMPSVPTALKPEDEEQPDETTADLVS